MSRDRYSISYGERTGIIKDRPHRALDTAVVMYDGADQEPEANEAVVITEVEPRDSVEIIETEVEELCAS